MTINNRYMVPNSLDSHGRILVAEDIGRYDSKAKLCVCALVYSKQEMKEVKRPFNRNYSRNEFSGLTQSQSSPCSRKTNRACPS
jgi:hypothetical protein